MGLKAKPAIARKMKKSQKVKSKKFRGTKPRVKKPKGDKDK